MEWLLLLGTMGFAVFAGMIGAMLGLGGGVFMILFYLLALNLPAHQAVALSLIAVVGSSCIGGSFYIKEGLTNLRLAMSMETFTVTGAVMGAFVGFALPPQAIQALLGVVLFYTSWAVLRRRRSEPCNAQNDRLGGEFYDMACNQHVRYRIERLGIGFASSLAGGIISGIIGIGGGVLLVPIMNAVMKIPMKAAAATSNFMVGLTAAASAAVYYSAGAVDLQLSVPSVLGVMVGAFIGTKAMVRTESAVLKKFLSVLLVFFGVVLLLRAWGILSW
uniref:Probable membrane transporter protein n=1 Tax=Candidatus Methanomethylicus mesodigestus TaxID=1867258 RepID=A0A7C3ESR2_9CREN